jgi:ParB-like chromosome segregation protein Spo0J
VERRPVADLVPYARTHSDEQIAQIAASIREWGWTIPLLVDEAGTLIAGHGRLLAAQRLGIESVPVMVARGWSEAKRRAYAVADNRLPLSAGWDEAMLALELSALDADQFDLSLLGFDPTELGVLLNGPDFGPATAEEQGRLDQLAPKIVTCPHCGEEFDTRGQE